MLIKTYVGGRFWLVFFSRIATKKLLKVFLQQNKPQSGGGSWEPSASAAPRRVGRASALPRSCCASALGLWGKAWSCGSATLKTCREATQLFKTLPIFVLNPDFLVSVHLGRGSGFFACVCSPVRLAQSVFHFPGSFGVSLKSD